MDESLLKGGDGDADVRPINFTSLITHPASCTHTSVLNKDLIIDTQSHVDGALSLAATTVSTDSSPSTVPYVSLQHAREQSHLRLLCLPLKPVLLVCICFLTFGSYWSAALLTRAAALHLLPHAPPTCTRSLSPPLCCAWQGVRHSRRFVHTAGPVVRTFVYPCDECEPVLRVQLSQHHPPFLLWSHHRPLDRRPWRRLPLRVPHHRRARALLPRRPVQALPPRPRRPLRLRPRR